MFCHINPRILFLIFVWPAVMIYLCLAQTLSNILPTFLFFISYNFTIRADAAASCRRVFRRSASVRFIRPLGHCRTSRQIHRSRTPAARLHPLPHSCLFRRFYPIITSTMSKMTNKSYRFSHSIIPYASESPFV